MSDFIHVDATQFKNPTIQAGHKLAVIVPYRDRQEHLAVFLPHMKNYLQNQGIDHSIYIIEQEEEKAFNRAKLLNIGFLEASADHDYFVMHDVDMLPENVNYGYQEMPTHLAAAASQFSYGCPYPEYFGGVTMFNRETYRKINGYSNLYWGWGGEDDDVRLRVRYAGLSIQRMHPGVLTSLHHEKHFDPDIYKHNAELIVQMYENKLDWGNDGLNSCTYSVLDRNESNGTTTIRVSL